MKLKLTLRRPQGTDADIVVTTDATATIAEIADTIVRNDPAATSPPPASVTHTLKVTFPRETVGRVLDASTPISDAAIASGVSVAVLPADAVRDSGQSPVLAVLRVIAGPDKGREFQLRRASVVIGRDSSADIVLNDKLVSKRHARVDVGRTVDFVDLNSANGIVVDGGQVSRVSLETGQTVELGDTVFRAEIVLTLPDAGETGRTGPVMFNRSPRVERRYPGENYDGPEIPKEEDPLPFPWVALAAPAIMGVAFIFMPGVSAFRFLFIALAPVIMIGTFLSQLSMRRRKHKISVKKFEDQLAYLAKTLEEEVVEERQVRLQEAPSTEELLQAANELGPLLWTRRPEHWSFLNVRLGVGVAPSRNTVKGLNVRNGIPDFIERFEKVVEDYRLINGVPVVDSIHRAGAFGIAGRPEDATEAAQAVFVQLASLYSPAELAFSAIVSPTVAAEFEWLKWLPHTTSPHTPLRSVQLADSGVSGAAVLLELEELIARRTQSLEGGLEQRHGPMSNDDAIMLRGAKLGEDEMEWADDDKPKTPSVVVLISADAPFDKSRLISLTERAAAAGVYPIWIADSVADLPAACRTFVDVAEGGERAQVGYVRTGESYEVALSRVSRAVSLDFAKALSGVSDAGAWVADQSDMPRSVSFVTLLGKEMLDSSEAVIDRWTQNDSIYDRTPGATLRKRRAGRLRAIVGQSSIDAMHLDLRTQGPHALVGGTTGSGKSEFLQAWVLGMAAEYSPDRVTFLFVDYKGGSAFADCVSLPHCVGIVTDLNQHLVRRALTSLRAELHFREHLLNRKKAKDLIELEKRGDPECPPALVLVIDEFAALVGEVPEFVDGVVDIAQRGRSLGIHLIMATQRPAGVIRDNLRANTNLRIALRMADSHDSIDVIGSPIAASFDASIPGRGVVKTGPERVESFQTGYAGGFTRDEPEKPAIAVSTLGFGQEQLWEDPSPEEEVDQSDSGPNDTARLVATMTAAAQGAHIQTPRKPWLDELGRIYDLALLRQRTDTELVIGVTDDPLTQQQYPIHFKPDVDGNIGIYGTGGSGKSTALRTLAIASAITPRGGPVQVYGIDFSSGGLRMLETLPHVGAIVSGDDAERITRLIRMLRSMIDERTLRYGDVRASTIAEYRTLAGKPDEPRILLLVDGMATFRQEYEFTGTGSIFSMFQQILSDGRQVGVHAIVTADRTGSVSPTIASSLQRRIALRLADENEYMLLDAPNDVLQQTSPPGRALFEQRETQIAVFGGSANVAEQSLAIDKLAAAMRANGVAEAPRIEKLSDDIDLASIVRTVSGGIAIGVADDTLSAVGVEPAGVFLIAGPPASGRTTALDTITASLKATLPSSRIFYFGNARSRLFGLDRWEAGAAGIDDVSALAKSLLAEVSEPATPQNRVTIVLETATDFLSTQADADLIALLKAAKRNEHFVIAEGETSALMPSWPLLMELKSARRGFALQPDAQEGEILFRTAFPRAKRSDFPPGRGWLVQGGKTRRVQLAWQIQS